MSGVTSVVRSKWAKSKLLLRRLPLAGAALERKKNNDELLIISSKMFLHYTPENVIMSWTIGRKQEACNKPSLGGEKIHGGGAVQTKTSRLMFPFDKDRVGTFQWHACVGVKCFPIGPVCRKLIPKWEASHRRYTFPLRTSLHVLYMCCTALQHGIHFWEKDNLKLLSISLKIIKQLIFGVSTAGNEMYFLLKWNISTTVGGIASTFRGSDLLHGFGMSLTFIGQG